MQLWKRYHRTTVADAPEQRSPPKVGFNASSHNTTLHTHYPSICILRVYTATVLYDFTICTHLLPIHSLHGHQQRAEMNSPQ